jgi:hypothetical protein
LKKNIENYSIDRPESVYESLKGLADAHFYAGNLTVAESKYLDAYNFIDTLKSKSEKYYFDVYLKLAEVNELQNNFERANEYRKSYGEELELYMEHQAKIEKIDKKYNLDLITKRYYSLVAQQEKNQQIEFYGGLTIAFFLLVIAALVAYSSYQKYIIRTEIEKSINILNN